jgi:MoaA/NifB/PqqE/SkfB family radical SAM enzyme
MNPSEGRCPFIETGAIAVSWDGAVSPCLGLIHSHVSYLYDNPRAVSRYVIGNVNETTLSEIWNDADYLAFRKRVQDFDFSPCTWCGGCDMAVANQDDCFGNTFPTCDGCLWAWGVIQCP